MNFTTPENKIHQKYNFSSISRRGKTLKNFTGRLFKLRIFKNQKVTLVKFKSWLKNCVPGTIKLYVLPYGVRILKSHMGSLDV